MAPDEKACTEMGMSCVDSALFWAVTTTSSKAKPFFSWARPVVAASAARAPIFKARIVLRMVAFLSMVLLCKMLVAVEIHWVKLDLNPGFCNAHRACGIMFMLGIRKNLIIC